VPCRRANAFRIIRSWRVVLRSVKSPGPRYFAEQSAIPTFFCDAHLLATHRGHAKTAIDMNKTRANVRIGTVGDGALVVCQSPVLGYRIGAHRELTTGLNPLPSDSALVFPMQSETNDLAMVRELPTYRALGGSD
jgi:hypothetical protein